MVASLDDFERYLNNNSCTMFIYDEENQDQDSGNSFDKVIIRYNSIIVQPDIHRIILTKDGNGEYMIINRVKEVEIIRDLVSYTTFIISSNSIGGNTRKCIILSM